MRPLEPGDSAPAFRVNDVRNGQQVTLDSLLREGRFVLIAFHRFATCPFCNYRVHELVRRYDRYHPAGLRAVAFFESTPEQVQRGAERLRVTFPMAADPALEVYNRYSVGAASVWGAIKALRRIGDAQKGAELVKGAGESDGARYRLPADFLVGADGRIRAAHYGSDIGDHMPFSHIEAALGPLPPEARPPRRDLA